jgi:hypothetical protein
MHAFGKSAAGVITDQQNRRFTVRVINRERTWVIGSDQGIVKLPGTVYRAWFSFDFSQAHFTLGLYC